MNRKDAITFLGYCGVHPSKVVSSKDWVRAPCPLAPWTHDSGKDSNPSFAIRLNDHGESFYNCFTCHSGDCLDLLERLSAFGVKAPKYNLLKANILLAEEATGAVTIDMLDHKDYNPSPKKYDFEDEEEIPVWDEEWLTSFSSVYKVTAAREYLASRNVDLITAGSLDLRYDASRGCICFPIRDWAGDLVGMRGRRINPGDAPKYHMYDCRGRKSSLPWYGEHWLDVEDRTVVMVESVFDVAAVYPVYNNVCAPLTVGMSRAKVKRMNRALHVVTLFDNGAGGDKARAKVSKYLSEYSAFITHILPPEGVSDPGDMTRDEIRKTLDKCVPVR